MTVLVLMACAPEPSVPEAAVPAPSVADPAPAAPAARERPTGTAVVLLGTGTPVPDPERSGPSTAVIAGGRAWIVDAGPGTLRRAAAAKERHGLDELQASRIDTVLLTHLHSDHTTGLPDLLLGGWVVGREAPLRVIGPPGTRKLVDGIVAAWAEDVALRTDVEDHVPLVADVTETTGGPVLEDGGVRVSAFEVPHGAWKHALGFRLDGPDGRSVVVSGDTASSDAVVEACAGCSVLVHEVYARAGWAERDDEDFRRYHATFHTSGPELGALAARAKPGILVLTHQLYFGSDDATLLREVREGGFEGRVESGVDLALY